MQRDSIQGDILITAMPITLGMSHDIHKSVSKLNKCNNRILHIGYINMKLLLKYLCQQINNQTNYHLDERHFLSGYDSALFYGAYAYQYDREASGRQYR